MGCITKMNYSIVKWAIALPTIFCTLLLWGCEQMHLKTEIESNLTLGDIAYDANKNLGYTIYLSENEKNVPYLVLTNDYGGNVLLLRKHLLDEMKPYRGQSTIPSYYEESEIDRFLNDDYFRSLSDTIRDIVVDSVVIITDIESIGSVGTNTQNIHRKIFLLSYSEVAQEGSLVNAVEGRPLKYFIDDPNAVCATTLIGEAGSWWLRTPNTAYLNTVYGISPDGYVGVCSVGGAEGVYENGVRPALCLPKNTAILRDDIDGMNAYIIRS